MLQDIEYEALSSSDDENANDSSSSSDDPHSQQVRHLLVDLGGIHKCYPFDLLSYKCRFSTDRVKESIDVNDYLLSNKVFPWQKYKWD